MEKTFEFVLESLNGSKSGFELPDDCNVTITGNGKTSFAPVKFTEAGVYSFGVTETDTKEAGYTYDAAKWTVDVTVSDTDSILSVTDIVYKKAGQEVADASAVAFENVYHVTETSLAPEVEKIINGSDTPVDKVFTFTITENEEYGSKIKMPDTNLIITGSKKEAFENITFYTAGTYEFTIAEVSGADAGYTYDTSSWNLTVTVTDTDSVLSASAKYEKNGVSYPHAKFKNTYVVSPVDCILNVEKKISGDERPQETDFTFRITETEDYGDAVAITDNDSVINGNGTAEFSPITFKAAGIYNFEIKEVNSGKNGYIYSNDIWRVEIIVSDDESVLSIDSITYFKNEADSERTSALFENEYHITPTTYIPRVEKRLTGEPVPEDKDFTFTLIPEKQYDGIEMSGDVSETVRKGSGYAIFDEITFVKAGTYNFRIVENQGTDNGYSYSKDEWILTIVVEDIDSVLTKTDITYSLKGQKESHAIFTNTYDVTPAEFVIPVEKTLSGDPTPVNKKFSFVLSKKKDDENGVILPENTEITIDGEGNSAFDPVQFIKAGDYSIQVREIPGNDHGYSYDGAVWTVDITVKDIDSVLTISDVKYQKDGNATEDNKTLFDNVYSVTDVSFTPQAVKIISGELTPADKIFNFKLIPKENYKDIIIYDTDSETETKEGHVSVTGAGAAAFGKIRFKEAGIYEFYISEEKGSDPGYNYDPTIWTLKIKIEDNDGYLRIAEHSYTAEEKMSDTEALFENVYTVKPVEYAPCVVKTVIGDPIPVDQTFTFKLLNISGKTDGFKLPKEVITMLGSGEKSWNPIVFTKAGTYQFRIEEESGSAPGYAYDDHQWMLNVEVEDIESELHIKSAEYRRDDDAVSQKAEFTNEYKVKEVTFEPKIKKIVNGPAETDDTFWFKLTPKEKYEDIVIPNDSISIFGEGEESYEPITIKQAGIYEFTIEELEQSDRNYDYDKSVWTIEVVVEDIESQLTVVSAVYSTSETTSENNAVFMNQYTKPGKLVIEKEVTGSGNKKQDFTFLIQLTDRNGQLLAGGYTYEKRSSDMETLLETGMITNGVGEIKLKHGQSVSMTLPYNTKYTISEAEADTDGYTTTVLVNGTAQDTDVVEKVILSDETDKVLFNNKKGGKTVNTEPKYSEEEPVTTYETDPSYPESEVKEYIPEAETEAAPTIEDTKPLQQRGNAEIPKAGDQFDFILNGIVFIFSGYVLLISMKKKKRNPKN